MNSLADAEECLHRLRKEFRNAELIGSLGKGATQSSHDIDILLRGVEPSEQLQWTLLEMLGASSVEDTDWGGWYFHDTVYGDIDIFFDDSEFDR
jgi:hypothetical protein